jgi:hypothetical protein
VIKPTNFITADQAQANVANYLTKQDPIWNRQALERIGKITERINIESLRGATSYTATVSQEGTEVIKKIIKVLRSKAYGYKVSEPYTEASHYIYIDISW